MDLHRMLLAALPLLGCAVAWAAPPQPDLLVFANNSLSQSLLKVSELYASDTGQHVTISFGASQALAKQIESGGKADVVLCADPEWIEYLERRKLLDPLSKRNVLRSRLVLIAQADSRVHLAIAPSFKLHSALETGKLAIGEPEAVGVGRFARYALISLGVWNAINDQLLTQPNSRAIMDAVADGRAPLGVVMETDALSDRRVRVVDVFPVASHPPIAYLMASTPTAQSGAARFMQFLRDDGSRDVFQRYGFRPAQ